MKSQEISLRKRLEVHTNKTPTCWLWTACTDRGGYGRIRHKGVTQLAHRMAWEITFGPIPNYLCVLHKCDVRTCVRPDHLFLGTLRMNVADMVSKDRIAHTKGSRAGNAKLTEDQVLDIRARFFYGESIKDIAKSMAMTDVAIRNITNRNTWNHI